MKYDGTIESGTQRPTLVLMHFLGGSTREWDEVIPLLGPDTPWVALDLPGFGASATAQSGYTVEEMAKFVEREIARLGLTNYVLVGHSMSGKVSAVLARRHADRGEDGAGLKGMVLLAPSPPCPEPMGEEKRIGMLELLGEQHADDRERARRYITKNEQRDLPKYVEDRAVAEVLRMDRAAWVAWLTAGSKEDWAERVGVLTLPVLVVAGGQDTSLGTPQQREVTLPHFSSGDLLTLAGCSHLIPMERPVETAALLRKFVEGVGEPNVPEEYRAFLLSNRVSVPTRAVLERRMAGPVRPQGLFTALQEQTLRALLSRLVRQESLPEIDLTGAVMARLASGRGDGWRFDKLPTDAQAYREGLDRLAAKGFVDLAGPEQDAILTSLGRDKGTPGALWFEEVRGDSVTAYMAHPATLARIGYGGFGVGGAETEYKGFVQLGPNAREAWEPVAVGVGSAA